LSIVLIFSKNQLFVSLILCIVFLVSILLLSDHIFISLLLLLDLACSYFSRSVRSFIWGLSVLLIYGLMALNFPLRTAFAVFHRF
jgi:hypothetical protein